MVIVGGFGWKYSGGDHGYFYSIQQTSDGGFIAAGVAGQSDWRDSMWLMKSDSTGAMEWEKTFLDPGNTISEGRSVRQTADSGYLVIGYSASPEENRQRLPDCPPYFFGRSFQRSTKNIHIGWRGEVGALGSHRNGQHHCA